MAPMAEVVSVYQKLKSEWTKSPQNLELCSQLLARLKIGLTTLVFLPTQNSEVPAQDLQQQLLLARNILEIGAQHSIEVKDIPAFERYMAQLKCYYLDYKDKLPESAFKDQLFGLNLLLLLSQNRVAEFHTELELLPADQIQSNVYIRHPVSLEQYLMEGNYNKIFLAKGNVPAKNYNYFIDILLETVRGEIATCLEKAYKKISAHDATRMLNLPSHAAVKEYGAKRGWKIANNYYIFKSDEKKAEEALPAKELVGQVIEYAHELEMIV